MRKSERRCSGIFRISGNCFPRQHLPFILQHLIVIMMMMIIIMVCDDQVRCILRQQKCVLFQFSENESTFAQIVFWIFLAPHLPSNSSQHMLCHSSHPNTFSSMITCFYIYQILPFHPNKFPCIFSP